jgi:hypothetical protein
MKLPVLRSLALVGLVAAQAPASPRPASPFAALPQTAPVEDGEKSIVRPAPESILAQSTILNDGSSWTLVPKGAVLHIPAGHQAKVGAKPVGTLLPWSDFLARNFSWLGTCDIDLAQAAGTRPMAAELPATWTKLGKVVVAVHFAGPISVKPAPAAAENHSTASTR